MDREAFALLLQEPNYLFDFVMLMFILMGTGLLLIAFHRRDSALAYYGPQILYLTFLLPIVLMLAVFLGISKDAVVGLVGVIIGYSFGIAPSIQPRDRAASTYEAGMEAPVRRSEASAPSLIELPERQKTSRWRSKNDLRSKFGPEHPGGEEPGVTAAEDLPKSQPTSGSSTPENPSSPPN